MTGKPLGIRVISVCVFRNAGSILVTDGFDSAKNAAFHRPLGGGIEPGETSAEAVAREVREELGLEIENLTLLGVLENIFTWEGDPGHEIAFVYDGWFADASVYERRDLAGIEADGGPVSASWRRLDSFDMYHSLVPEGLAELLDR